MVHAPASSSPAGAPSTTAPHAPPPATHAALRLSRRQWLARSAALAVGLAAWGCTPPVLRVSAHAWIGYEPLFMAQSMGWLPPQVQLTRNTDGLQTQDALAGGQAEAAALTLDELLRLKAQGVDAVAVLVFDISAGADQVLSRALVHRLNHIRGLRVGVEMGGVGALMLHGLLAEAGLRVDHVQLLDIPVSEHIQAWDAGRVDVLITYEPIASLLRQRHAHLIMDSRQLPDTIFDVLAVQRQSLQRHRDGWAEVVHAHLRAIAHLRTNPQDAIYRIATQQHSPAAEVMAALRGVELPAASGNLSLLQGKPPRLERVAQELVDLMLRHDLLRAPLDVRGICDAALVAQAAQHRSLG